MVIQEGRKGHAILVQRAGARVRQASCSGHADGAAIEILEASTAKHSLNVVRRWLERHRAIGHLHLYFEAHERAPGAISHVHHVEIQNADLQVATRAEDAFAFADGHAVRNFGADDGEAENDGGEESFGKRKGTIDAGMVDLTVVGWWIPSPRVVLVGGLGTSQLESAEVVHCCIGIGQGAVEGPVICTRGQFGTL